MLEGGGGKCYRDLFVDLLRLECVLAITLYRRQGIEGSLITYVLANPPIDLIVLQDDIVF